MKPPRKYIKVFGGYIEVKAVKDLYKDTKQWGGYDPFTGTITYDPSDEGRIKSSESVAKTIIHEDIHANRDALGLYGEGGQEEESATELIETAICAFIMDNLDWAQWIVDEFRRIKQEVEEEE